MKTMEADELGEKISEVLREVEENGKAVDITRQGKVVARVVPTQRKRRASAREDADTSWVELEKLIEEISAYLPGQVDAVQTVNEIRREL